MHSLAFAFLFFFWSALLLVLTFFFYTKGLLFHVIELPGFLGLGVSRSSWESECSICFSTLYPVPFTFSIIFQWNSFDHESFVFNSYVVLQTERPKNDPQRNFFPFVGVCFKEISRWESLSKIQSHLMVPWWYLCRGIACCTLASKKRSMSRRLKYCSDRSHPYLLFSIVSEATESLGGESPCSGKGAWKLLWIVLLQANILHAVV